VKILIVQVSYCTNYYFQNSNCRNYQFPKFEFSTWITQVHWNTIYQKWYNTKVLVQNQHQVQLEMIVDYCVQLQTGTQSIGKDEEMAHHTK